MCSTLRFARWLLPVLVVALDPAPALAQPRVTTLDELHRELAPGDPISLVQTSGEALTGRLLRFGDRDLDVRIVLPPATGQPRRQLDVTIPLTAIQSLERPRDSSRNGALIGAGIGAGFVGTMFVRAIAVDRNEIDEWGPIYLGNAVVFAGLGALIGWAIDVGHSKPSVRFDKSGAETTRISLVPLGSRGRGMALAVSF
ncbi:MAG: hypothetical protein EHM89_12075 [Acidobacteria bacterium]|nr:MAG: hypothetical protein EHM89_12075 [Acidobacteriota bacterium]